MLEFKNETTLFLEAKYCWRCYLIGKIAQVRNWHLRRSRQGGGQRDTNSQVLKRTIKRKNHFNSILVSISIIDKLNLCQCLWQKFQGNTIAYKYGQDWPE